MPLPVQAAPASTMPAGGSNLPGGDGTQTTSAGTTGAVQGGQAGAAAGTGWMPVFQLGAGQAGVPSDARGLIAGEQPVGGAASKQLGTAASTAFQAATAAGSATGQSGPAAGGAAGASTGDSLGAGSGTGPNAQGGNIGSNPAPKATTQAQRNANNAQAQQEYPGYVGAG